MRILLILSLILIGCGRSDTKSPGSNQQQQEIREDCIEVELKKKLIANLADVAQASFKITQTCKTDIQKVLPHIKELKGVRDE